MCMRSAKHSVVLLPEIPLLLFLNLIDIRSPALVLRPVKLASKMHSQSVPMINLWSLCSTAVTSIMHRRGLHTKCRLELIVGLGVTADRILWKQLGSNLKLELKLSL